MAEGARLESVCTVKRTEGSNPSLSAIIWLKAFMRRRYIVEAMLIITGLSCLFCFLMLGSSIDQYGVLHEPFALIPIGYSLIALGLMSVITRLSLSFIYPANKSK